MKSKIWNLFTPEDKTNLLRYTGMHISDWILVSYCEADTIYFVWKVTEEWNM